MKSAFYFTLKILFISKIFQFFLDYLVKHVKDLIRKVRLLSKLTTLEPGKQTNAIHTLPNISKSKVNRI